MYQTLLLNSTYECISFIKERKVFKLLAKDKVEVLSSWDQQIFWGCGKMDHPAVIRLKHHVRWIPKKVRFNRVGVFHRDQYCCQYCSKALTPSKLTIDHIIPVSRGGDSSWKNTVTACYECNNFKGSKTPEEARMTLLKRPTVPLITVANEYNLIKNKHKSWNEYIFYSSQPSPK